ncbi:hypothetical protein KGF54_003126 [Candida jiufengensis]|uniref:uncharacterized protein n=1 Tax=Candida jiufengensis TaxID=497108 RepID=UPI0022246988|nr:uncharacterized protein KGF54_003126 [Candida jiufengensis]KAI5952260.1 hypothetical protein KGF54_003126 [Candida jiufengensis]
MSWFNSEPTNTRMAMFGSIDEEISNDIPRYNSNPFISDEDVLSTKAHKTKSKLIKFFKSIGKLFQLKRKKKYQKLLKQVDTNLNLPPNYESIVPARHVTTNLSLPNNHFFCFSRKLKCKKNLILIPTNSIESSINSLFDILDQNGTGATTADSAIPV